MSCQPWSSHQSHRAQENQSARVAFTLLDEDDVGVGPSRLLTATLTLIDLETERIINSRNAQNVINANNVTITEEGRVTWDLQGEADNVLVRGDNGLVRWNQQMERHRARFYFTWAQGGQFTHDVFLLVTKVGE